MIYIGFFSKRPQNFDDVADDGRTVVGACSSEAGSVCNTEKDNCPLNQVVIYYVNEQQKQCLSVTKMITIIKDMVLERHVHTLQNQKTVRYFNITSNIILTHLRQK